MTARPLAASICQKWKWGFGDVYNEFMVHRRWMVVLLAGILFSGCYKTAIKKEGKMKIESSAFSFGNPIPIKYTCDGENVSPPLNFTDIPSNTKSLVLIMDDVDAPAGVFTHWIIYNLAADTGGIKEAEKAGTAGKNTFGQNKYGGPCPGSGEHRYYFRLYALDTDLSLPAGFDRKQIENQMGQYVIETAETMGRYKRK